MHVPSYKEIADTLADDHQRKLELYKLDLSKPERAPRWQRVSVILIGAAMGWLIAALIIATLTKAVGQAQYDLVHYGEQF